MVPTQSGIRHKAAFSRITSVDLPHTSKLATYIHMLTPPADDMAAFVKVTVLVVLAMAAAMMLTASHAVEVEVNTVYLGHVLATARLCLSASGALLQQLS